MLFFDRTVEQVGIWLFLTGSVCFALRPTVHLVREVHYWRIGEVDKLAELAQD